jgi:hypothetical protein
MQNMDEQNLDQYIVKYNLDQYMDKYNKIKTTPAYILCDIISSLDIDKIKDILDQGIDPNTVITECQEYDFNENKENSGMHLLRNFRFIKSNNNIEKVKNILILLIDRGLNLKYINYYGLNILDYVARFKWDDTDFSFSEYILSKGGEPKTGKKFPDCICGHFEELGYYPNPNKINETKFIKLLDLNKYEKKSSKLYEIYLELIKLEDSTNRLKTSFDVNDSCSFCPVTTYELFCSRYHPNSPWTDYEPIRLFLYDNYNIYLENDY